MADADEEEENEINEAAEVEYDSDPDDPLKDDKVDHAKE